MTAARPSGDHGALMDSVYRGQRHIYDATRKFFLFGRDKLIEGLQCQPGDSVLEVGCGTGRNLAKIARRWPGTRLYGLDISSEMLKSASDQLGDAATLALGDATRFDPQEAAGQPHFDRVILSFALSMIPDWKAAIGQGAAALAPGGSLHIVDFGNLNGLPPMLRFALRTWLSNFHVSPRPDLGDYCASLAARRKLICRTREGPFGYFRLVRIDNPRRTSVQ